MFIQRSEASLPLISIQIKLPLVSFPLALAVTLFWLMVAAGLPSSGFVSMLESFRKDHVTLKTRVMAAGNLVLPSQA